MWVFGLLCVFNPILGIYEPYLSSLRHWVFYTCTILTLLYYVYCINPFCTILINPFCIILINPFCTILINPFHVYCKLTLSPLYIHKSQFFDNNKLFRIWVYITHPSLGPKDPSKMIKSQFFDDNSMNTKSYTYLKLIIDVKYSVQFAF